MTTPYRFVHTADIHLDSPLQSLALRDPELAELIGNATRKSFVRTVDLCIEEQVDALLLTRRYRHIHFAVWFLAVEVEVCRQAVMN